MDIKFFNEDLKFKLRVSGIWLRDGKVLLDKYGENKYCLPGGYVSFKEDSIDAVLREMHEETNLEFRILNYGGVIENFFQNFKKQNTQEIDFYYYVQSKDENAKDLILDWKELDHGHLIKHYYEWVDLTNLKQINLVPHKLQEIILKQETNFHYIVKDITFKNNSQDKN